MDFAFAAKVFAALFAIMNPIANVPVFLALTEGMDATRRRTVALTAAIAVSIGCVVSAVAGGAILRMFGLSVDDFRLAGGLLLLLIAVAMLHGTPSRQHVPDTHEGGQDSPTSDIAIYPLAIPILLGPGTIATLIVLGQTAVHQHALPALAIGLGGFLALLWLALLSAPVLGRYISAKASAITQRLMGMLLAAIAVEMMTASVRNLLLAAHGS